MPAGVKPRAGYGGEPSRPQWERHGGGECLGADLRQTGVKNARQR